MATNLSSNTNATSSLFDLDALLNDVFFATSRPWAAIYITLAILFLTTLYLLVSAMVNRRDVFPLVSRTAIVTGGSQGLGLSLAKSLSRRGCSVMIVAQNVEKLQAAVKEVSAVAKDAEKQRFEFVSADLRSQHSAEKILEKATSWNAGVPPDIVLNCAGNCHPSFFADADLETLRGQMDTVYWSAAYMAHATLRAWTKEQKSVDAQRAETRHLIFTSSVAAFLALPGYAPYTPAKAAMRALADTLNMEVQVYNGARGRKGERGPEREIKVHAVYPMGIQSPGFENEEKIKPALTKKLEESDKPQGSDEMAGIIVGELQRGRHIITTTMIGNLMKGWAMAASQRVGISDYLYGWAGSIAVLFVTPDFLSQSFKWGRMEGMKTGI